MKRVLLSMVLVVTFILGTVYISQATTQEEVLSMIEKVQGYWKANGKEKTLAEINNPKGQFVKGELYVYAMDFNGVMLAHGANQKLVGKDLIDLKDPNGLFLSKVMIEAAKKGGTWVDYTWVNPATKKVQPKTSFCKKIDGETIYIAAGIWK